VTGVQTCALPISPKPQNPIITIKWSKIINRVKLNNGMQGV